jgi:hypothetical protein
MVAMRVLVFASSGPSASRERAIGAETLIFGPSSLSSFSGNVPPTEGSAKGTRRRHRALSGVIRHRRIRSSPNASVLEALNKATRNGGDHQSFSDPHSIVGLQVDLFIIFTFIRIRHFKLERSTYMSSELNISKPQVKDVIM